MAVYKQKGFEYLNNFKNSIWFDSHGNKIQYVTLYI